ncbi:hypothetical protein I552_5956 [Mycobacterium xenopi 3993]|nr:hypothetical protein I552_5956 [Mycobacterium xenopi 3993]
MIIADVFQRRNLAACSGIDLAIRGGVARAGDRTLQIGRGRSRALPACRGAPVGRWRS